MSYGQFRLCRHALGITLLMLVLIVSAGCHGSGKAPARRGDLYEAAANGNLEVVKHILERGVDVNRCRRQSKETALHQAALNGHTEVARLLLENGADVNGEGRGAGTPLLWAVYTGQIGTARMLLAYGADIDDKNTLSKCGTALHAAVSHSQPEMVKYLLSEGADVNSEIGLGLRPLHLAAYCDKVNIANILLEHGADPTLRCDGRTAFEIAHSDEFRELLAGHRANREQ